MEKNNTALSAFIAGWEERLKRRNTYCICIIKPEGYPFSLCFTEIASLLRSALQANGRESAIVYNQLAPDCTNILLGYHLLKFDRELLKYQYIPYQLEQLSLHEGVFSENIRQLLAHAPAVWDYSHENIQFLRRLGIAADYLGIGYHEHLEQLPSADYQDIDVLFYGVLGERRTVILDQLRHQGLNVKVLCGVFGEERDRYIARSKLIINIHYYAAQIFEAPRIAYLLNNRCFVLSEESPVNPYPKVPLCLAPYQQLVEQCRYYLTRPVEMEQRRQLTYTQFKLHYPMVDLIKAVL